MSNRLHGHISAFAGYFCLLLAVGLLVRSMPGQPDVLVTISDFGQHIRMTDPLSFSKGALDIYQHGWFLPENMWLIRLWPPGFMLLEGGILKVGGLQAPFILVLIILAALLHALLLTTLRHFLSEYMAMRWATLVPLVLFLPPVTRIFLLEPLGLVLGEGFSVGFFLLAALMMMFAVRSGSAKIAGAAGALLALAAYFRSQYELLILFMTLLALPCLIWAYIQMRRAKVAQNPGQPWKNTIKVILVTMVVAHACMLPWRLHNLESAGTLSWVQTQTLVVRNALMTEQDLLKAGGRFVVDGGGHLACKLEPDYCGKTESKYFYLAFLQNIVGWYKEKLPLFGTYWFSSIKNFSFVAFQPTWYDKLINAMLLLCVAVTAPLLWITRRQRYFAVQLWLCTSFYAAFFLIFSLVQLEVRYFYLMKIFGMLTTVTLLAQALSGRYKAGASSNGDFAPSQLSERGRQT